AAGHIIADEAAAQTPQRGPQRVGRWQLAHRRHYHLDASLPQAVQLRIGYSAIEGVEGVGDQHYLGCGPPLARGDERLGQFRRQWAEAVLPSEIVEQEHIQDDQFLGLGDHRQRLVEDLLLADALTIGVLPGLIQQQLDV